MYATSGPNFLPMMSEDTSKRSIRKRLLFIDSRDKDPSFDDTPFNYTIYFDNPTKKNLGIGSIDNIVEVEIKAINFPKIINETNDEQYGILNIEELTDALDSSDKASHRSSCIFFFDGTDSPQTIYPIEGNGRTFVPRNGIKTLDRLSITFSKYDTGILESTQVKGDTADKINHSILLEISTLC